MGVREGKMLRWRAPAGRGTCTELAWFGRGGGDSIRVHLECCRETDGQEPTVTTDNHEITACTSNESSTHRQGKVSS